MNEEQVKTQIESNMSCCAHHEKDVEHDGYHSQPEKNKFLGICVLIAAAIIGGVWLYTDRFQNMAPKIADAKLMAALEKVVLPVQGVTLPVRLGNLGKQMINNGIIDQKKFESLYDQRGGLDEASKRLLTGSNDGQIVITKENSGVLLNLFWALGLANKNAILEKGPIVDKQYGGDASRFASTGGWTLTVGNPMNHYNHHVFITLTPEQQKLVEEVSKNIYRPCCGNSTYFPDCNHGMAMLGLLELMASQGVNENDMYKAALAVNSFWFPDTYLTIAQFLKIRDIAWKNASPKEILGKEYSSAIGYQQVRSRVAPAERKGSNSCSA